MRLLFVENHADFARIVAAKFLAAHQALAGALRAGTLGRRTLPA